MEWSWRTVLILLALLLVAGIVFDGLRRMRKARMEALRLDVDPGLSSAFSHDQHNPELPGGFRVLGTSAAAAEPPQQTVQKPVQEPVAPVARKPRAEPAFSALDNSETDEPVIPWEDDLGPVRVIPKTEVSLAEQPLPHAVAQDLDIPPSALIPKARPVNLDEQVPVLLDVEELGAEENSTPVITSAAASAEQLAAAMDDPVQDAEQDAQTADQGAEAVEPEAENAERDAENAEQNAAAADKYADDAARQEALQETPAMADEVDEIPGQLAVQPVNFASPEAEKLSDRAAPEVVLEIHCIARDPAGFSGKDILFLFNSCDLRFGEKDIFHRYEQPDGKGCIQFSVAQSFNPGIFVPAAMAQQHFRGLSFFMSLPGAHKPLEAYEAMSGMALVVARQLQADLFDGARSALTHQTIEHDRQQIIDFDRRQRLLAKKQARS